MSAGPETVACIFLILEEFWYKFYILGYHLYHLCNSSIGIWEWYMWFVFKVESFICIYLSTYLYVCVDIYT